MKFKSMSVDIPSIFDQFIVVFEFLENNTFKVETLFYLFLLYHPLLAMFYQVFKHIRCL